MVEIVRQTGNVSVGFLRLVPDAVFHTVLICWRNGFFHREPVLLVRFDLLTQNQKVAHDGVPIVC